MQMVCREVFDLFWNNQIVDMIGRSTGDHILHAIITLNNTNMDTWVMSFVYVSTLADEHNKGWEETKKVSSIGESYAIVGDFNYLLHLEDKPGGRQVHAGKLNEL